MRLLEDLKGILEGNHKTCWSAIIEWNITFAKHFEMIDNFLETTLKLIIKVQEIVEMFSTMFLQTIF